jgi:hypothetical protein
VLKGEINMNKIRKISVLLSISLFALSLIGGFTLAKNNSVGTAIGSDVSSVELKAITVESWECTNSEFGWEVYTDKDKIIPPTYYDNNFKYEPKAGSSQATREAKLVTGVPGDLAHYLKKDNKLMGLKFHFTYPGYNEVTVRPPRNDSYKVQRVRSYVSDNDLSRQDYKKDTNSRGETNAVYEIYGIELPGVVKKLSVWVLGRGNEYSLEGWLEDWKGDSHIVKFGSLDFIGWRPLSADIPSYVPQDTNSYPAIKTLVFKQFKIRSTPQTSGETVYLFLDELKALTDVFEVNFDGNEVDFDDEDKKKKIHLKNLVDKLGCKSGSGSTSGSTDSDGQPTN